MSENDNDKNCKNMIEFLYHPINYKKNACQNGEFCQALFCPDYHTNREYSEYEYLRKLLLPSEDSIFY